MKVSFDPSAVAEGINQSRIDRNNLPGTSTAKVEANSTIGSYIRVCKSAEKGTSYSYGKPANPTQPEVIGKAEK